MFSPADRMVEATMEYDDLRPQKNDREKLIAAALEFLIEEYGYTPWDKEIIDVKDIKDIIDELRSTVTLETPAH